MPQTTWHVLNLLLASRRPRPVAEFVTELGSPVAVAGELDTLGATSLVGRTGALVFVTSNPPTTRAMRPLHCRLCDQLEAEDWGILIRPFWGECPCPPKNGSQLRLVGGSHHLRMLPRENGI
jgi:hypothetical protein